MDFCYIGINTRLQQLNGTVRSCIPKVSTSYEIWSRCDSIANLYVIGYSQYSRQWHKC